MSTLVLTRPKVNKQNIPTCGSFMIRHAPIKAHFRLGIRLIMYRMITRQGK
jgi:hypothetical protein